MKHFKSKTLAFVLFLSFFCPFDVHDIISSSTHNGHIKYVKKLQIKDKRSPINSRSNFSNSKKTIRDTGIIVEYYQAAESKTDLLYFLSSSPNSTPPITKYAVWSKSTFC